MNLFFASGPDFTYLLSSMELIYDLSYRACLSSIILLDFELSNSYVD